VSIPSRQVHLRLGDLTAQFDAVQAEYPALPTPVLLRLILASILNRPTPEITRLIDAEIRRTSPNERGK
jgi:hypothetical protein